MQVDVESTEITPEAMDRLVAASTVTWEFVTAGDAIFTVEPPADFKCADRREHYTYWVQKSEDGQVFFVKALRGPDNTKDYVYLGLMNPNDGSVRTTGKSKFKRDSTIVKIVNRVLIMVRCGDQHKIVANGWKLHHEGRCGKCGRLLTTPESIERGIGPICVEAMQGGI